MLTAINLKSSHKPISTRTVKLNPIIMYLKKSTACNVAGSVEVIAYQILTIFREKAIYHFVFTYVSYA